ncbi:glycosyltransferase [Sinosporangium siamense]|uniref:Glycosyltransferase 2-like domain-containing protein n=1 Tax=Sinosporangium siamense TaxID=1367973 RepID=A0A919V6K5_9ACTN|nr:glycosyltransferase [Sinosporangium siamense]GII91097.1 hypothetical protein Ssi02_13280 [Sinosporangium siamense]
MLRRPDRGAHTAALLDVVVPACNEEGRLPSGLRLLCAKLAEMRIPASVIVVDNASTDRTADIVRAWPRGPVEVRLVSCGVRGKGAAVRAGLLATTAPYVGYCDADMATDLDALDTVLAELRAGRPAVIGSRAHPWSVVEVRHNPVRRMGAWVFRAMARVLVGRIGDTQCGFKFFAGDQAREAAGELRETGFAFDVELLARMRAKSLRVLEIPVRWRDVAGSTFSVTRHSLGIFGQLFKIFTRVGLAGRGGSPRLRQARPTPQDSGPSVSSSAA